jgi:hypothetical protein
MATAQETGHAKNTANFRQLLTACIGYGATYNPARPELVVAALITQADLCDSHLDALRTAVQNEKDAINARELEFKNLSKYATRIINALAAYNTPKNSMEEARSLINKLNGKRIGKIKLNPDGTAPNTISVSQMSMDMRVDTFEKLAKLVTAQPNYNPNEIEVQSATITTHASNLRTLNQTASTTRNITETARILRDKDLYTDANSLFNVAANIKNYVKYLYGASSPEFKQISSIKITNNNKK